MLLFSLNASFRGAGDASAAMRVLWLANGLNIVLDPLLIFGLGPIPALGIQGAAVATLIGRGCGVLLQLWILFRSGKHLRVSRAQIIWHGATIGNIVRTSLGGVGQMVVGMTSWIFLMRILASIGSEAVAGATIALRVLMFVMTPAWGMSNAAATLVGQNLGAGEPGRAESSVWRIGAYNMVYLLAVSIFYFTMPRALIGIFTDDPDVIAIGAGWLRILSYSLFVYGWWMVSVQAFNGAGDTVTPTWINVVFFWLVQIPLSWLLAVQLDHGHMGVFWGVFISETSVGLFTLWLFTRGKWKTAHV
jgi:putative MATE family efflux protein